MGRTDLARFGTLVFVVMLAVPALTSAASDRSLTRDPGVEAAGRSSLVFEREVMVIGYSHLLDLPETTPSRPARAAGIASRTVQPAGAPGVVLASWYGPGFYGNRTACGRLLTPETLGVAHLSLPCGTLLAITSPLGRTLVVPVIDRGPYVAGRTLDLTYATKVSLACSDLCSVQMSVAR